MSSLRIGIYIYDNVEVLDFAGPYEVFTTASRVNKKMTQENSDIFEVITIGKNSNSIRARAGLVISPDMTFANHPPLDVLIIPGGIVTEELNYNELSIWIAKTDATTQMSASICTGAFLLAKAGLLEGKKATTHWEDMEDLEASFPQLKVIRNVRWVDEGHVITSAGISAGIDMSLHIVRRLISEELASKTAHQLEFDWKQND